MAAEPKLPHIEVKNGQRFFVDPLTKTSRPLVPSTRELIASLEARLSIAEGQIADLSTENNELRQRIADLRNRP